MMRKSLILMFAFLAAACSTPSWTVVSGEHLPKSSLYRVNLPQGWMKFKTDQYVLLTKDGVLLQNILIKEQDAASPLPYTRKRIEPGMPISDIAALTIAEIKANPAHIQTAVLEEKIFTARGREGFYLLYRFSNPDGLIYQNAHYGVVEKKTVFHLIYMAPQRYYFTKDIKTFEALVDSFHPLR